MNWISRSTEISAVCTDLRRLRNLVRRFAGIDRTRCSASALALVFFLSGGAGQTLHATQTDPIDGNNNSPTTATSPSVEWNKQNDTWSINTGLAVQELSDKTFETFSFAVRKLLAVSELTKAWVYLEIDKSFSEEFQRILGGTLIDVGEYWRLNLSLQDLQRLELLTSSWEEHYFDGQKQSLGFAIDYFGLNNTFIKKLTLATVYSETDNHSFGKIGTVEQETASLYSRWDEYLYYQGAENTVIRLSSDIKLADNWKLTPSLGATHRSYNDLWRDVFGQEITTSDNNETRPSGGATVTYQTENNQARVYAQYDHDGFIDEYGVGVGYRLGGLSGVELQARIAQIEYDEDTDLDSDTRILAGLTYAFGWSPRYAALFANEKKARPDLQLGDAMPVAWVADISLNGRQHSEQANLVQIDKNVLRQQLAALINQARQLRESQYTPESWSNLQAKLAYAVRVYNDGAAAGQQLNAGSTWQQLNQAITDLTAAMQGLKGNAAPIANAGPDQSITSGQSVTLNGSWTDVDGTIAAYEWSTGATTQDITVSPTSTTTYTLRVKDNSGNWSGLDSMTVTVGSAAPPPAVNNRGCSEFCVS